MTQEEILAALDTPQGREVLAKILLGSLRDDERVKERIGEIAVLAKDKADDELSDLVRELT